MAIYRPAKNSKVWWYDFIFEGQRFRESSKSRSKTVARDAERARRHELEESYNGIKRRDRAKLFSVAADEWLELKKLTLASSSHRIERDNLKHLLPHFENRLISDIRAKDVNAYQKARLAEKASPKTITGGFRRQDPDSGQVQNAQFPDRQPAHCLYPFERCGARGEQDSFGFTGVVHYDTDPTRPIGDWKEAWEKARERAGAILRSDPAEHQPPIHTRRSVKRGATPDEKSNGKDESKNPKPLRCRFHDLRHTAVTRLLEAGIPYPVVASLMGWSAATAIRMAKRYGHIGNQSLRDAADVLGQVKIPTDYLKKPPKSREVESVAQQ
jgi:integrase